MSRLVASSRTPLYLALLLAPTLGCYGSGAFGPEGEAGNVDGDRGWSAPDDDDNGNGWSDGEIPDEFLPVEDGTGTEDDPADDSLWADIEEPTIQPNVHVLEDTPCYESVDSENDDRILTFHFACDPASLGLDVGHIVVGSANRGYLREITSVDVYEDSVVMETTQARLEQVFENGGFDAHIELQSQERYRWDHSGKVLYSGSVGSADLTLKLSEAVVDFDPSLRISTEFQWFRLNRARAVLDVDLEIDLELLAQLSDRLSLSREISLGTYRYPFAFAAGPIPVAGTLEVELKAGFSTSASGSITATAGMDADADITVGGAYRRGRRWTYTQRKSFEARLTGPDIEARGDWEGRVYVSAEATIMLYKVAGPTFSVEPFIHGEADAECYDLDWAFDAGAKLNAGFNLDVWVLDVEKRFGPWTIKKELGDGTITLPFPLGTNCDGAQPSPCSPVGTISCGQTISGDTTDGTVSMDAYPVNVGNYHAAELVYTWQASTSNDVEFRFIDPHPSVLNHDIIILDGTNGQCINTSAVAWGFNTLEFTPTAGNTYHVVVDGYDGDVGAFQLELDCNP
jgi:hypothetical protein